MTTHAWSTDAIPARERFAMWREWRAAQIFGVTAELDHAARGGFQAAISSRAIGAATLVDIRATAYRARRTRQDIDRVASDSLCIYQQTTGPDWVFDDGSGERMVVPRSSIALGYSDLPYETVPITLEVFQTRLVKIPLSSLKDPQDRRWRMRPRLLQPRSGLDALLHAYAIAFFQQIERLGAPDAEAAVEVLGRLALMAEAATPIGETEGAETTVTAAQLNLAYSFIAQNLHRPNLSPAMVARALGLSLRHIHRLFEPTGTSVARHVLNARIDRVARSLTRPSSDSVIETAFACGFSGSSVFYRAFRQRYGMSPTDYRDRAQEAAKIFSASGAQRETVGAQWDATHAAVP